jgi:hypothetical protein
VDPQKVCHVSESLGWHFASQKTSERNSFFMPKHKSDSIVDSRSYIFWTVQGWFMLHRSV